MKFSYTIANRPKWDDYFLAIAYSVALRGDCRRSQVGAVMVDANHRIRSTGYNGVSPGEEGCLAGACPRGLMSYDELPSTSDYSNCISTHAELNALLYCDPEDRKGCTLYVTRRPCLHCKSFIVREGIVRIVFPDDLGRLISEPLVH